MDISILEQMEVREQIVQTFYLSDVVSAFLANWEIVMLASIFNSIIGFSLLSFEVKKSDVLYNSNRQKILFGIISLFILFPLLLAPVLISKYISEFHHNTFGLDSLNNPWILFSAGILFHSWLAYYLLKHVFNVDKKILTNLTLQNNLGMSGLSSRRFSTSIIVFVKPYILVTAICFILNNSMFSLPAFTSKQVETFISFLFSFINDAYSMDNTFNTLNMLVSILLVIISFFCISYLLVIGIKALFLLRFRLNIFRRFFTSFKLNFDSSKIAPIFGLLFLIAGSYIIFGIISKSNFSSTYNFKNVINTLWGQYLLIAGISCLLFLLIHRISISFISYFYGKKLFISFHKFVHYISYIALLPPVIFGLAGFIVAGKSNAGTIEFMILLVYSFLLILFFFDKTGIINHLPYLFNFKSLGYRKFKQALSLQMTKIYSIMLPIFFTLYFLWIEDGITTILSDEPKNFANTIRGFRHDDLVPEVYAATIVCFLFFLTFFLIFNYSKYFMKTIVLRILKNKSVLVFLFSLIGFQSIEASSLNQIKSVSVIEKEKFLQSKYSYFQIEEMNIKHKGICYIYLNDTIDNLVIDLLNIQNDNSVVCFIGGTQKVNIEIRSVKGSSRRDLCPEIEFEKINLGRLKINGNKNGSNSNLETYYDLTLNSSAYYKTLNIVNSNISSLSIFVSEKSNHIFLNNLKISTISIETKTINTEPVLINVNNISFLPNENNTPLISLSNIYAYDLTLYTKNDSKCKLGLRFNNIKLHGNNIIETNNVETNLDIYNLKLASSLNIHGNNFENIVISELNGDYNKKEQSHLIISAPNIIDSQLKLVDIGVDNLTVNLGDDIYSYIDNVDIKNINLTSKVVINRDLLEWYSKNCTNPIERRDLLKQLQEKGIYDDRNSIGLDALYYGKKSDLNSIQPILSWLIDKLTGYGINLRYPFQTFLLLLLLYLGARFITLYTSKVYKFKFLDLILDDNIVNSNNEQIIKRMKYIKIYRITFNTLIFVQITLLSIYLSQTTLQ